VISLPTAAGRVRRGGRIAVVGGQCQHSYVDGTLL
jgi:hypothetical protein